MVRDVDVAILLDDAALLKDSPSKPSYSLPDMIREKRLLDKNSVPTRKWAWRIKKQDENYNETISWHNDYRHLDDGWLLSCVGAGYG